jgi:hypothetical protein
MPRTTLELPLSREPLYESAATFLAVLANPECDKSTHNFRTAVCRGLIRHSVERDESAWISQAIRPGYFLMTDQRAKQELAHGQKRLVDRKTAAIAAWPLFDQVLEGKSIDNLLAFGTTLPNNAEGRAILANAWLRTDDTGVKNLHSRRVKPSRPVIHLAYAFWRAVLEMRRLGFDAEGAEALVLMDRDRFKAIVRFSEICRRIAPMIPALAVSDGDLIELRLDC